MLAKSATIRTQRLPTETCTIGREGLSGTIVPWGEGKRQSSNYPFDREMVHCLQTLISVNHVDPFLEPQGMQIANSISTDRVLMCFIAFKYTYWDGMQVSLQFLGRLVQKLLMFWSCIFFKRVYVAPQKEPYGNPSMFDQNHFANQPCF
jgi:hypothetical protein